MKKIFLLSVSTSLLAMGLIGCDEDSPKCNGTCKTVGRVVSAGDYYCQSNSLYQCGDNCKPSVVERCGNKGTCNADEGVCDPKEGGGSGGNGGSGNGGSGNGGGNGGSGEGGGNGGSGEGGGNGGSGEGGGNGGSGEGGGNGGGGGQNYESCDPNTYPDSCNGSVLTYCAEFSDGSHRVYSRDCQDSVDAEGNPIKNTQYVCAMHNAKANCLNSANECDTVDDQHFECGYDASYGKYEVELIYLCVQHDDGHKYWRLYDQKFCSSPCTKDQDSGAVTCEQESCDTKSSMECAGENAYVRWCATLSNGESTMMQWLVDNCQSYEGGVAECSMQGEDAFCTWVNTD